MQMVMRASAIAILIGLSGCASAERSLPQFDMLNTLAAKPPGGKGGGMQADMKIAAAALAGGDTANAIRIYRSVAQTYPMAIEPRLELGEALLAADAPHEAARAFEGAEKLKRKDFRAVSGLARSRLALRQPAEALRLFDRAIAIAPHDGLARNGKAVALDQLGRHGEAQAIYLDLLDQDPSNMKVRSNFGLSLALQGREDEAADVLASLSAAPDAGPRIRQNLAFAYGLAGNDGQAAHVSRLDLDEEAVQNNLKFFQRLRNVSGPVNRVAAISAPSKQPVAPSFRASAPAVEVPIEHDWAPADEPMNDDWDESRIIAPILTTPLPPQTFAGGRIKSPRALQPAVAPDMPAAPEPQTQPALRSEPFQAQPVVAPAVAEGVRFPAVP